MLKKRHLTFLLGVLFFITFYNTSYANPVSLSCPDSTIIIIPFPIGDPTPPKAPVFVPISASYEPLLTSVILTFNNYLGDIKVEVMNTTTNGYSFEVIDSQLLSAIVPLTIGNGHYILLFTLPSGQQFQGELDVSK